MQGVDSCCIFVSPNIFMMKLFTTVEIPKKIMCLSHADRVLMFGSCFATEMGKRLEEAKFRCDVNPYGVLYNPFSIATAIREIAAGKRYEAGELFLHEGCWHSSMHHGSFSSPCREEVLESINSRLEAAQRNLKEADCLMLTWGSAYVYESKRDGRVVGNCHKLPEREFYRRRLQVEEIVKVYKALLEELLQTSPNLQLLFTVSPIRHVRDGLHENQLSKAVLLLAVEELQRLFPDNLCYFPAYELVLDELRDYRFFADDLVHPSQMAVEYVWQRFCEHCLSPEALKLMEQVEEIRKALQHKPFRPESEAYQGFIRQIVLKIEQLTEKYPYLVLENERELCRTRLNK